MDDGRGRQIGVEVGIQAFHCAEGYAFPNGQKAAAATDSFLAAIAG